MKVTVISVGKIKEDFFQKAILEYGKRLSSYCDIKYVQVKDEKAPETMSEKEKEMVMEIEGKRILSTLTGQAYVIVLDRAGKMMDSIEFSQRIDWLALHGKSHINFVVGGSLGLSTAVLKRANETLSFSKMTFPHQLMKVILLEQIYRAFRISRGEAYHK